MRHLDSSLNFIVQGQAIPENLSHIRPVLDCRGKEASGKSMTKFCFFFGLPRNPFPPVATVFVLVLVALQAGDN